MDLGFILIALVINALLSLVAAYIASEKGRSGVAFWVLGFLVSSVVAILIAIGVPSRSHQPAPFAQKKCNLCKEQILRDALVCRFCGSAQEITDELEPVRSWCPGCKSEHYVPTGSACPVCGKATHPWD